MKVLHSYCLNHNIGDYALAFGLKSLLRKYLDISLIAETNLQGQYFDACYINEVVNKKYDLLVIGGGGIIHGKHWPNGWFWLIDLKLINEIKIPFIIYGVGNNYWDEEGGVPERAITHLKEVKKLSSHFSVRNDGSHERLLAQTGIDAEIVPDPGFHVDMYDQFARVINEKYIIIQLAFDKPEKRFGSEKGILENFVNNMKKIVHVLSKKYKVLFVPHVYEDLILSELVSSNMPNTYTCNFGDFAFDKSKEIVSYYKHAEFVIAMRGHGQIIPISFNVPIISLQNHPKHLGLMKELNLEKYNVYVNDKFFYDKLITLVDLVEKNKEMIINDLKAININMKNNSEDAFNQILLKTK